MREDNLYKVAIRCAELNNQGCNCQCDQCQYNIFQYVNDTREAALLKANAYTDYHRREQVMKDVRLKTECYNIGPLFALGFIIFCIWFGAKQCGGSEKTAQWYENQADYARPAEELKSAEQYNISKRTKAYIDQLESMRVYDSLDEEIAYLKRHKNEIKNVPRILGIMHRVGVRDVDGDGKVNCIDYSCTFRYLYGTDALLITNRSDYMNHLFVRVIYDNEAYLKPDSLFTRPVNKTSYMEIEPQELHNYLMKDSWGGKYIPRYNKDTTDSWHREMERVCLVFGQ